MEPSTKLALGLQSSLPERWACPQDFSARKPKGASRAQFGSLLSSR